MKQYYVYIPGDDSVQGPFPAEMIRNAYEQGIYSDTVMLREVDSENRLSISSVFAKAEPAFPNKEENEQESKLTMKPYFYLDTNNQQVGPISENALVCLVQEGSISSQTLVWTEGFAEWLPFGGVFPAVVERNTPSDKLKPPAISIPQTQQAPSTKKNSQLIIGGAVALITAVIFAVCFDSGGSTITREEAVSELRQAGVIASELDIQGRIGSMAMATACAQGNSTIVKLLLAGGITARQLNQEEVLKIAAENGHVEIVELLLTAPGISPNSGYPLEVAASHGHTEIVKLLLAAPGIEVNRGDPLIKAVENKHTEVVRLLLAAPGIDVNEGEPLWKALFHEHGEALLLLLKAPGINVNKEIETEDGYYRTILDMLAESGNAELIKHVLAVPGIDVNKGKALSKAVEKGHVEVVKLLLAAPGIDVNAGDCLSRAASGGHTEVVKLLLAAPGIDVNAGDSLSRAASGGHTEVVKMLLAAPGINVNRASSNSTPLEAAIGGGHAEIVRLLLAAPGIDVNASSSSNSSPLWQAAMWGHSEIVKQLLTVRGIDVNKKCTWQSVVVHFNAYGAYTRPIYETPLSSAASGGHTEVVKLLLAAPGIDINEGDNSPLSEASSHGHTEIVQLLLAMPGINVNKVDERGYGYPPLERARRAGYTEIVNLLRAAGARE